MRKKRVYYPIDKAKIQEAIELYLVYAEKGDEDSWNRCYDIANTIGRGSHVWMAIHGILQACYYSDTLDVEHVYSGILALGINTQLEDYYGD